MRLEQRCVLDSRSKKVYSLYLAASHISKDYHHLNYLSFRY